MSEHLHLSSLFIVPLLWCSTDKVLCYSESLHTEGKYTYKYAFFLRERELVKHFKTFAMRCCYSGVQDEKQDFEDGERTQSLLS